jgi:hypothetical protein
MMRVMNFPIASLQRWQSCITMPIRDAARVCDRRHSYVACSVSRRYARHPGDFWSPSLLLSRNI